MLYLTTIPSGMPVTVGKDQLTTANSAVTPWRDRRQLGKTSTGVDWPSKSVYVLREEKPNQATERQEERYPQGRARAGEDDRPTSQLETNTPDQSTTRQNTDRSRTCSSCGKVLKNEVGLKIHRTKMGCPPTLNLVQRTRQLGETEEELDLEEHHSVQSLQSSDEGEESNDSTEIANDSGAEKTSEQERRKKVKWPASAEKAKWKTFEEELDLMMENILVGKADNKLHTMSEIIYIFGKERFGIEQGRF